MATAFIKTAKDQIICSICFEIFSEPKALPCLHTFCKKCINKYIIQMNAQHRERKGYPCPVCRRHVSVPARIKHNPEVWASQLENNHAVITLIDGYKTSKGKTMETCTLHLEKDLEFFCVDHTQYICSLCFPQHRRCNDVTTREEARCNVKQAGESKSNKSAKKQSENEHTNLLLEQCSSIEQVIDKRHNALEFLCQTEQQVRDEMISMRKRSNELIDKHNEIGKNASEERNEGLDQTNIQQSQVSQMQNIKLAHQGKPSWITGITILPSGKILLIDHTNEAVFVFSLSLDFQCKTNIHPAPYDVAPISTSQDHMMVSIPDTRELVKCKVLHDGFVEVGKRLKSNIRFKAVASDSRHVAVCSDSDIHIFETDGEVWMVVLEESYETTKFTYITLTSSEKKVFITDQTFADPHVRCVDFDGLTLWKVVDARLSVCSGISIMGTQLMVMSWNSGEIFTLSFNRDNLNTFNKGSVVFPWKLGISARQNVVCVSQHKNTLSEEDKRTVKVFKLT
ncbi:E3 ubiquitin-protein ligase TRIM38-like [Mizuhopecten yessoensis]|uniref:Tripartite motif-containing 13 n=1 Tax=Mizuhopecten yessoensis TaxID=6573 RepID=A0A210Q789_MIZYE|nr:E3 ubiquitin-protein ligase TRIM38-like [Mizuhopecten yessoensis]OWF44600.1 Tripartite motif-containing 13 [Mizuhopecten yessoensis]